MASPGSYIRSAARATFSAYRRLPIRWRLAGGSAGLTFAILLGFVVVVGSLTTARIRKDFNTTISTAANDLQPQLRYAFDPQTNKARCVAPDLDTYASAESAVIRLVTVTGVVLCQTAKAPDLGEPGLETVERGGYRVESRIGPPLLNQPTIIQ